MKTARRRLWIQLVCYVVLAVPILACGSSGPTCRGWVEDDLGRRHSPESGVSDRSEARANACNVYCVDADPQADAMYRIWLDSPQGNPSLERWEGMYEDPRIAAYLETCASRCVADVAAGRRPGGVDCQD